MYIVGGYNFYVAAGYQMQMGWLVCVACCREGDDVLRIPPNLGWESPQHVSGMSARQPNVGTFGQHPPVVVTQNQSQHSIFVSGIANIHPICILVPELHTKNSSVRFVGNI